MVQVWDHLNVDKPHIAYAVVGVFSAVFSLISLFVKERLYIGEATVAAIVGLIVGPHCLNWFAPTTWGNTDRITLEISRIVLCLQIFAVAVELPKKYMLRHWLSVAMLLVPVMTAGWLIVGAFVYLVIPGLNFPEGLLVAACITATDPVLAAAVVGKGKFARRVPGHLRNILTAESGCNDGMAFPFIYLSLNLIIHKGHAGEIIKDWICVTILYECIFGCVFGAAIGYFGRHAIKFAENHTLIDRESFLSLYIFLAFTCAGFGSMLGVDDLLVSFAAGTAFAWDGWFAQKTEESNVSTVIDLVLNLSYFVYFGAIVPWPDYNNSEIGTNCWRLIILAIVVIFLRRIPAVMALKPLIPDIKSWREALFCAHFGPIGVGAIFAAILARAELEGATSHTKSPLDQLPSKGSPNYQLVANIWPIVTFLVIASIIVHGSSVAVITLGRHLHTMAITMSMTTTTGNGNSSSWMSRLPDLKSNGRSFSLHRIDTLAPPSLKKNNTDGAGKLSQTPTVETSGIPVKPAGGMKKKKRPKHKRKWSKSRLSRISSRISTRDETLEEHDAEKLQREKEAQAATFALGSGNHATRNHSQEEIQDQFPQHNEEGYIKSGITPAPTFTEPPVPFPSDSHSQELPSPPQPKPTSKDHRQTRRPTNLYAEGNTIIIEDQHGEIIDSASLKSKDEKVGTDLSLNRTHSRSSHGSASSIIKKTGTLLERITSNGSPSRERSKLMAYRLNDQLVIENEDGEIVRRYKINQHAPHNTPTSDSTRASRSNTVVNGITKAISSVIGLKSATGSTPQEMEQKSSPLLPTYQKPDSSAGSSKENETVSDDDDEEDVGDSENEEDDDFEDSEDSEASEAEGHNQVQHLSRQEKIYPGSEHYDEEETPVERARRLTALGKVKAPRDEDDEEESPISTVPGGSSSSRGVVSSIGRSLGLKPPQEQVLYDSPPPKQSIQFQDPPIPRRH